MPAERRQRGLETNYLETRLSRTLVIVARLFGGFLLGFTVTVTFTMNPGILPDSEVKLL